MQRGLMKEESFDTLGYHRVSDFEYTGGEVRLFCVGVRTRARARGFFGSVGIVNSVSDVGYLAALECL